jgi:TRAP-type C4-dicarboxylate transport system permease small subunit
VSAQNSNKPRRDRWSWVPGYGSLPGGPLSWIDLALIIACVIGLAAMSLALIWQVVSRYVLSSPTVWSEEFSLVVFVWVAMLGIAVAVRRGEHLTLDVASRMFSKWPLATKILATLVTILVVVTLGIIAWACIQLLGPANRQSLAGIEVGLGIPAKVSWAYAALPVGLGLAAVFSVERLALLLTNRVTVLNADADQQVVQEIQHDDEIAQDHGGDTKIGKDL